MTCISPLVRSVGYTLAALCGLWLAAAPAAILADDDLSFHEETAIKGAVSRVAPSVVQIETFGGLERVGNLLVGTGPTTGLAVSADGYIVSSAFNFVQKPAQILVDLGDGARLPATLVATDHNRMVVLLKVKLPAGRQLTVPVATPEQEMRVGQWAIAVGRTFDRAKPSVSVGIISALRRIWGKALQTDAKISPNNYGGPLVDIQGRVLGVLVPMSPQANDELAGTEWYDSGIGFAVPLEQINRVLPKLEQGEDLHAGLLGVSLKGTDIYVGAAEISAIRPNSPAALAGFKSGDKIVEIEGHKITRQAELRHQLVPHYAGDKIRVVVLRGKDRIEKSVELVAKLLPYQFPFLGVLPLRTSGGPPGVAVRYVYADSPAAKAGLKLGDRIVSLESKPVKNRADLLEQMASFSARDKVKLEVQRAGQTLRIEIELASLPEAVPADLPPSHESPAAAPASPPAVGIVHLKIPEFANTCLAYVPENYHPDVPHGVVVWLHPAGGYKDDALVARWKELCQRYDLILLAPKSSDPERWQRTELGFIRKTMDEICTRYNVDKSRLIVFGQEGGGGMAYLLGLSSRDLVHGVATVEAPLPAGAQPQPTDPVLRQAFYIAAAQKSAVHEEIEATAQRLRAAKYPVTWKDLAPGSRTLSADELAELARWIDTLDRI